MESFFFHFLFSIFIVAPPIDFLTGSSCSDYLTHYPLMKELVTASLSPELSSTRLADLYSERAFPEMSAVPGLVFVSLRQESRGGPGLLGHWAGRWAPGRVGSIKADQVTTCPSLYSCIIRTSNLIHWSSKVSVRESFINTVFINYLIYLLKCTSTVQDSSFEAFWKKVFWKVKMMTYKVLIIR